MNNERFEKFDYKLITLIVGCVIFIIGLFIFFKGIGARREYNALENKMNAQPQVTYTSEENRERLSDKKQFTSDADNTAGDPSIVYEFNEPSKDMVLTYTNADETISSLFEIIYDFTTADKYASRQERAIPFITDNLKDSDYLLDGKSADGVSIVDARKLESKFISAESSFTPIRDDGMLNALTIVTVESSSYDQGEVTTEYYFDVLYNRDLNKVQNFNLVGIAEMNPFNLNY